MNKLIFCTSVSIALFFAACGDDSNSVEPSLDESSSSITLSSSSSSAVIPGSSSVTLSEVEGSLTDTRDGQTYKTVTIGSQTWMAENLNLRTADSYCYSIDESYCAKYGRIYTWSAAMDSAGSWSANGDGCGYNKTCSPTYPVRGVCPVGWHLPTKAEFETLFTAIGGISNAGKMLKTTSGWEYSGNGTDDYSFSALPAGFRYRNGNFGNVGYESLFWCSTEDDSESACYVYMSHLNDDAKLRNNFKNLGFSVRCVKD